MQKNSIIRLLDENTINQIAAGEVIENTASIIKELVENSIDAKATSITIEIVSGGRQSIKIIDDGIGMSFDDVKLCLQRHATSKIKKAEDLAHIQTMGFRGEALSSISSVAKVKIFSKQQNNTLGTLLYAEGGEIIDHKSIDCHEGTKIEVTSLFFNAPVRRKFLKSVDTDIASCIKTVSEIALAYPQISFTLISNQKLIIKTQSCSLEERIKDVLGKDFLIDMYPLNYQDECIKIEGFVSDPKKTRPNKSGQYILLNNRFVVCPSISFSVMDAYATLLEPRRFPIFVLKIDVDPSLVDVNVHPQKREVRLRKEAYLRTIIGKHVEKTFSSSLYQEEPLPWQEPEFPKTPFFNRSENAPLFLMNEPIEKNDKFSINLSSFNYSPNDSKTSSYPSCFDLKENEDICSNQSIPSLSTQVSVLEQNELALNVQLSQIIGIWQTYILVEKNSELFFVDPKRIASKVYFEEYKEKKGDLEPMQQLLIPLNLSFSPNEACLIEQKKEFLYKLGIELRAFGPNTFIVEAHSLKLDEDIIKLMIDNLLKNPDEENLYKACSYHRALKVKKPSLYESEVLVKLWENLGFPKFCPNGHLIYWKLPKEKLFTS